MFCRTVCGSSETTDTPRMDTPRTPNVHPVDTPPIVERRYTDAPTTSNAHPSNTPWAHHRQSFGTPRTIHPHTTDCPRVIHAICTDIQRKPSCTRHGRLKDTQHTVRRVCPTPHVRSVHGRSAACRWSVHKHTTGYRRMGYGL